MIFSRRKLPQRNCGPAIAAFWRWWPEARARAEESINGGKGTTGTTGTTGTNEATGDEVHKRVSAIHPDLQWEFARGGPSEHALVVCAPHDPVVRAIAERWLAAAPPPDATWAYHSSRQADPAVFVSSLTIDGHVVPLEKMRFGVEADDDRREIDVTAFHPVFSVMTDAEQLRVTYLALDWALGETDVEVWVGQVTANRTEPQRPHTFAQLRSAVANLVQKSTEDDWALLDGQTDDGAPKVAIVRRPLKPARWPRFDTHLRVALPYRAVEHGMPNDESLAASRVFEDRLAAAIGTDGAVVALETSKGRRTLHLYVDGLSKAAATAKGLLPDWREGKATLAVSYDPTWTATAHLLA